MSRGRRATRSSRCRGRPLQPRFPKELQGEAPAASLQPRFAKEPHRRRAADDILTAKQPSASNVIRLEIERVKEGERARALAGTSAPPISSARFHALHILASASPQSVTYKADPPLSDLTMLACVLQSGKRLLHLTLTL